MSASAETQERWRQYYEKSGNQDRDLAGDLIMKAEKRVFWQTAFMIGSVGLPIVVMGRGCVTG